MAACFLKTKNFLKLKPRKWSSTRKGIALLKSKKGVYSGDSACYVVWHIDHDSLGILFTYILENPESASCMNVKIHALPQDVDENKEWKWKNNLAKISKPTQNTTRQSLRKYPQGRIKVKRGSVCYCSCCLLQCYH